LELVNLGLDTIEFGRHWHGDCAVLFGPTHAGAAIDDRRGMTPRKPRGIRDEISKAGPS
jgi:hypothetical protein